MTPLLSSEQELPTRTALEEKVSCPLSWQGCRVPDTAAGEGMVLEETIAPVRAKQAASATGHCLSRRAGSAA